MERARLGETASIMEITIEAWRNGKRSTVKDKVFVLVLASG
jgi:hypothetical protein